MLVAGPWTHLQDDFNCEDRSETNVKVSKNLKTERAALGETWVTCDSVFKHPAAVHCVHWGGHLAQQSL